MGIRLRNRVNSKERHSRSGPGHIDSVSTVEPPNQEVVILDQSPYVRVLVDHERKGSGAETVNPDRVVESMTRTGERAKT